MITPLIKVNSVDITDDIRYVDASFVSQVNGSPGGCQFAVRDIPHAHSFVFGQTITLDIDGARRWSGYVQRVRRQYTAEVVDTTDPDTVARWFLIEGVDNNILFTSRIVYDKVNPEHLAALPPPVAFRDSRHPEQWVEDTPSDELVKYVIEHYTDMFADGVTLGGVQNLGSPNPDLAAAYAASETVGDFMRSVNRLLGGIWYLTPDYDMAHRFTESATTARFLSDYDDGDANFVGPREYSFTSDATAMANDALVWGSAAGISVVSFSRSQDTTEQGRHGRWQVGEFNTSMYKQASLDQRAEALVYGNDASRHGANVDRLICEATIFEPIFALGDVVTCKAHVFREGVQFPPFENTEVLTAILPVRRMTISFATKTEAKFDLLLTQELDEPWSLFEYFWPKLGGFRGHTIGGFPHIEIPPRLLPHPPTPGGCDCGITDTFGRSTSSIDLGTSDSGLAYSYAAIGGVTLRADGSAALATLAYTGGIPTISASLSPDSPAWDPSAVHSVTFTMDNFGDPLIAFAEKFEITFASWGGLPLRVFIFPSNTSLFTHGIGPTPGASAKSQITWTSDVISGTLIPLAFWVPGVVYTLSVYEAGGYLTGAITDGTSTYTTTVSTHPTSIFSVGFGALRDKVAPYTTSVVTAVRFDDLTIPEVTVCNIVQFEDFTHAEALGWGTSTPGGFVSAQFDDTGTSVVSSGLNHYGRAVLGSYEQRFITYSGGPWLTPSGFAMHFDFSVDSVPSGIEAHFVEVFSGSDLDVLVGIGSGSSYGYAEIITSAGDVTADKTDWIADERYRIVIEYLPSGNVTIRVWAPSFEAEPLVPLVTVAAGPALVGDLTIGLGAAVSGADFHVYPIDFEYEGKPCFASLPDIPAVPVLGDACETLVHGAGSSFLTTRAFIGPSLRAWVNGAMVSLSAHNGVTGTFTLTSAILRTDTLRVCYVANGDPS